MTKKRNISNPTLDDVRAGKRFIEYHETAQRLRALADELPKHARDLRFAARELNKLAKDAFDKPEAKATAGELSGETRRKKRDEKISLAAVQLADNPALTWKQITDDRLKHVWLRQHAAQIRARAEKCVGTLRLSPAERARRISLLRRAQQSSR